MIPYYCNEAVLQLPNVHTLLDQTRQCLEIVTVEGTELQLVIERARLTPNATLSSAVEASIAERRRSLRGFELASLVEREFPEIVGVEARVTFVDKERGPLFVHEFHCVIEQVRISYLASCRLAHAAACDVWMHTMLQHLRLQ